MRKIMLILFIYMLASGVVFAGTMSETPILASDINIYLKYMLDLRQGGYVGKKEMMVWPEAEYESAYGTIGDYLGFVEVKTVFDNFEICISKLVGLQLDIYKCSSIPYQICAVPEITQPFINAYFKYSNWDWYFAVGMVNNENSHARFFTFSDIFLHDRRFDYLYEPRYEWYLYERIDRVNLGYANEFFSMDMKILPNRWTMFGNWETFDFYCNINFKFSNLDIFVYDLFEHLLYETHLNPDLPTTLGTNISFKLNDLILIYWETKTSSSACEHTFIETAVGARVVESGSYHIIVENFYSIDEIWKLFMETEKKNVFDWEGWDANVVFLYSPSEFNNFKTFFTMRKNWNENWLSEFRYGYESIGRHIIDASIRWYNM